MKAKLRGKYIPTSYRQDLLDQWQRLRQGSKSVDEYIAKFDEYSMRCDLDEDEDVVLSKFRAGLRDDIKRELYLREVRDIEQAYQIARNVEHFQRGPIFRKPEPIRNPSPYSGSSQAYPSRPDPNRPNLSRPSLSHPDLSRPQPSTSMTHREDKGKVVEGLRELISQKVCYRCHKPGHFASLI